MVSKKSVDRAFQIYQNKSITEIAIIQSLYANNDINGLRQMFNNYTAKNETIKGYGRLANQYITRLSKPDKTTKNYVKTEFNEILTDSTNLTDNVTQNSQKVFGLQKLKKGTLYPNFSKTKAYNPTKNLDSITNTNPFQFDEVNIKHLSQFQNQIKSNIAIYNKKHKQKIKQMRITIKYKTSNDEEHFYSTQKVSPNKISSNANQMMKDLNYQDLKHWKSISPKESDLINDLYKHNESIDEILEYIVDYYY